MKYLPALTLRNRLVLAVLVPVCLLVVGFASLFVLVTNHTADTMLRERALGITSFLAPAAEYGVLSGNRDALGALVQALLERHDVVAASIHDRTGQTLAISGRPLIADRVQITSTTKAEILDLSNDRLALAAPVLVGSLTIDDVPDPGVTLSAVEQPLIAGWVYLEVDTHELAVSKRLVVITTMALTLACLALTGLLATRLARSVAGPISLLADAVSSIGEGRLNVSVPTTGTTGELRALEEGFNRMARSIADAHDSLQARVDEATMQLAHQAMHDPLTGLPNRRAFEQALESAVSASRQGEAQAILCYVDLDRFKIVNDTCGHAAGDALLHGIATVIRHRVRNEDLICRIGGDEFALLLCGCSVDEGKRIAEALRAAIAAYRFSWEDRRFSVGASVGLVHIDGTMESAADATVAADLACYAAKKGGRNRVFVHEPPNPGGRRRTDILSGTLPLFADELPHERLRLHQQSIAALVIDGSDPQWIEVLLRIVDDAGTSHSPTDTLNGIEDGETLLRLDLWVAERALALTSCPNAAGAIPARRISLNVGRSTLIEGDRYLSRLGHLLAHHEQDPATVVLEFPARLAEEEPEATRRFADGVRKLGCKLALEHMDGASVGLLRTLKPDFVKVSFKTLVETYGMEAGRNLAQALCAASAALAVPAIASEVEDELFGAALADYGFDYAQGLVIAPTQAFGPA